MKKYLLLTIILLCFFEFTIAQNQISKNIVDENYVTTSSQRYTDDTLDYLPTEIDGTPYEFEEFKSGEIIENNNSIITNLFYRYNAYEDDIEVKVKLEDPKSKILLLNKSSEVLVKISGVYYLYDIEKDGYFKVLFYGKNYKLFKKIYKKYYPEKKAANSFGRNTPPTFEDRIKYFLVSNDDTFKEIPSSKKQRAKFFGDKKEEINKYITKYNLDITDENIFIKIVRYFDSITNPKTL